MTIYRTTLTEIGAEVEALLDAAEALITFEDGAPPELAEISVLHRHEEHREEPPKVGDVFAIGPREFEITAVGGIAWKNMLELGHASFKFNGAREANLPGEICLEKGDLEEIKELVRPGVSLEIRAAE